MPSERRVEPIHDAEPTTTRDFARLTSAYFASLHAQLERMLRTLASIEHRMALLERRKARPRGK